MTRDKNSQKAEKKPHSTSEPVTQPQPVISAQSEYPQKARTASAQQPAQKIGSESSAQKSARGSKNAAPAGSQKTTAVRTVEDGTDKFDAFGIENPRRSFTGFIIDDYPLQSEHVFPTQLSSTATNYGYY